MFAPTTLRRCCLLRQPAGAAVSVSVSIRYRSILCSRLLLHSSAITAAVTAVESAATNKTPIAMDVAARRTSSSSSSSYSTTITTRVAGPISTSRQRQHSRRVAPIRLFSSSSSSSNTSTRTSTRTTLPEEDATAADTGTKEEEEEEVDNSLPSSASFTVPGAQTSNTGKKLGIIFTCTVCDTRSIKQFTERAYRKGVVIVTCPGCNNRHLIADNLGYFSEQSNSKNDDEGGGGGGWNIEKAMEEAATAAATGGGSGGDTILDNVNNNNKKVRVINDDTVWELSVEDIFGEDAIQKATAAAAASEAENENIETSPSSSMAAAELEESTMSDPKQR